MNWIDVIILGVIIYYFFEGVRRGFVEQTLELIGFFITLALAYWIYQPIGQFLINRAGMNMNLADPMAFLLSWVILQAGYSLALRLTYPFIPLKLRSSEVNRFAGLVPAFLRAIIIISVVMTIAVILPIPAQLKSEIDNSAIGSRVVAKSGIIEGYMNKLFGRDIKQTLTFLTVPAQTEQIIEPNQTVDLKFTTTDVTIDHAAEQQMFNLVNQERAKVGLQTLVWDEQLAVVARKHSVDMFARGYFSHTDPDGKSPFDRMQAAGIMYTSAGENLAYAATVQLAHDGLMRSPGHRANILSVDFGHVGIGVIDGGIYGKMFTQNFTN